MEDSSPPVRLPLKKIDPALESLIIEKHALPKKNESAYAISYK
jgi:hypothetical protein